MAGNRPSIDWSWLLQLAGPGSYRRGMDYAREGRVTVIGGDSASVIAQVGGTKLYEVVLELGTGSLRGSCACPVGGQFCKHQVATALVWSGRCGHQDGDDGNMDAAGLAMGPSPQAIRSSKPSTAPTPAAQSPVQQWLDTLQAPALRSMLLGLAHEYPQLEELLQMRARLATGSLQERRKVVTRLVGRKRFMDWRQSREYAYKLDTLVSVLQDAASTDPDTSLELATHALMRLLPIYAGIDDSSGDVGDRVHAIGALHAAALRVSPGLDKAQVKAWLELALLDDWDVVADLDEVAAAFGTQGIALLESLLRDRLQIVAGPGARRRKSPDGYLQRRLHQLLERTASQGGDVEAMLTLRAQHLADGGDYEDMARLSREFGRERVALQWLERGHKAFPADMRLQRQLAQAKVADGLSDEALPLFWELFQATPGEKMYSDLCTAARSAGCWEEWRRRAFKHLDANGLDAERISIQLAQGEFDAAWEFASGRNLPLHVWCKLATRLEQDMPEQALCAYRTVLQAVLAQGGRPAYERAVGILHRMRALHERMHTLAGFRDYVQGLRQTYQARHSFTAMLQIFTPSAGSAPKKGMRPTPRKT